MSSVLRNDKVILIREYGKMRMTGQVFEVANVTETAVVLRDVKTKVAVGMIAIDEFDNYFKKQFEGWTEWEVLIGNGGAVGWYRTNGKKVQVKDNMGHRSEASCNKTDFFNLYLGINIAFSRCRLKYLDEVERHMREDLENIANDRKATEKDIRRIIKIVKPIPTATESAEETE